jgi:predicted TIM-barrel fold metal-dependent hydrolase
VVKPETAVKELQRMVEKNGFLGAVINGHTRGRYLDDQSFWPVLECAEALRVPIYLHPTRPPQGVADIYYGGFSPLVTSLLGMAGWGWHIETAVHIIRMIVGGVFDRYPGLQVIIGHMGETLPFMIQRMDHTMTPERTKLKRPIGAYLRENVHYTFSGFNYTSIFLNLLLEVGVDRMMFSADYPYASMREARDFLDRLPVSDADREKIAHGNAERLMSPLMPNKAGPDPVAH